MRTAAVGGEPLGVTDCLNYGNPRKPEIMAQIVEGIAGIKDACLALDAPVVSGNVSLYNQTDDTAVSPTPAIGVVSLVPRFADVVPRDKVADGDVLVRLGAACRTLQGSLAAGGGALPALDLGATKAISVLVRDFVRARLVKDARPLAAGGLLAALFDVARVHGTGAFAELPAGEDLHASLLGEEAPSFLLVVSAGQLAEVSRRAGLALVPFETLGGLGGHTLTVTVDEKVQLELDVRSLVDEAERVVPGIVG